MQTDVADVSHEDRHVFEENQETGKHKHKTRSYSTEKCSVLKSKSISIAKF